ncbi:hypothetical protein VNI00_003341 [Paramarasmius palmivorus]|uniref:Ribonuclease H1 N-terminal domain-containing protein n=1 Tax=Paramarasmius palmivorus TaxID=297713 RepID=A0AAW0DTJ4_9AGAR
MSAIISSGDNTASRLSRMEAIRRTLVATQEAQASEEALSLAQCEMVRASLQVEDAEDNLAQCLEQMTVSTQKVQQSLSSARHVFQEKGGRKGTRSSGTRTPQHAASTPPSSSHRSSGRERTRSRRPDSAPRTPSDASARGTDVVQQVAPQSPTPAPQTPTRVTGRGTNVVHTPGSPAPNPGGFVRSTRPKTANFQAYVVYVGRNNEQRICDTWPEAQAFMKGAVMPYHKGFKSAARARAYFQECIDSGVFEALKAEASNSGNKLFYIVTDGVAPGVYNTKYGLVRDGLQWRGGVVTVFEGTETDADSLFEEYENGGYVHRREAFVGQV